MSGAKTWAGAFLAVSAGLAFGATPPPEWATRDIRAGIIGCDTSHVLAFTGLFQANPQWRIRVVAAFPGGSPDMPADSVARVAEYHEDPARAPRRRDRRYDCRTPRAGGRGPGRERRWPAAPRAGPPRHRRPQKAVRQQAVHREPEGRSRTHPAGAGGRRGVLQFLVRAVPARGGEAPQGPWRAETREGPGQLSLSMEPHHPDLFWYGIHGVEALYTVMGRGCVSVTRKAEGDYDFTVGKWADGRTGVFRGAIGKGTYLPLVQVWGEGGETADTGKAGYNYAGLVEAMARFFQTGVAPIDPQETSRSSSS